MRENSGSLPDTRENVGDWIGVQIGMVKEVEKICTQHYPVSFPRHPEGFADCGAYGNKNRQT